MVLAFKEPAGTVCHSFEAFIRDCILLELEMISFLPIIFKVSSEQLDLFIFQEFFHIFIAIFKI